MCHSWRERTLFHLDEGRIGIVPVKMQTGDVVVTVNGAELPFVLRPVDSGRYTLVGTAYVDGITDGDALQGNPEFRTFGIC